MISIYVGGAISSSKIILNEKISPVIMDLLKDWAGDWNQRIMFSYSDIVISSKELWAVWDVAAILPVESIAAIATSSSVGELKDLDYYQLCDYFAVLDHRALDWCEAVSHPGYGFRMGVIGSVDVQINEFLAENLIYKVHTTGRLGSWFIPDEMMTLLTLKFDLSKSSMYRIPDEPTPEDLGIPEWLSHISTYTRVVDPND